VGTPITFALLIQAKNTALAAVAAHSCALCRNAYSIDEYQQPIPNKFGLPALLRFSSLQVDYLRAWMALVRPLPAAAEAEGACSQQLNAALAVAKDVVTRYAAVAAQVSLRN
jgi:hypothetical protein